MMAYVVRSYLPIKEQSRARRHIASTHGGGPTLCQTVERARPPKNIAESTLPICGICESMSRVRSASLYQGERP